METKIYGRENTYVKKKIEKATVASKWKAMLTQVILKMTQNRCTVHLIIMATTNSINWMAQMVPSLTMTSSVDLMECGRHLGKLIF